MHSFLLFTHSWLRWLVLIFAVWAIFQALSGWLGKRPYSKLDNKSAVFFIAFMHTQLLVGLILYFVSPLIQMAFASGMGATMKNAGLRFWAVEHSMMMILAVVFAQIGRTRSKRASTDLKKHKRAAIFFILALVFMLSRIPWHEALRLFRTSI